MAFQVFSWLLVAASVFGVVLNIRKRIEGFYVWAITNALWFGVDVWFGIWSQAFLMAVYFGLAIWGIVEWRKGESRGK